MKAARHTRPAGKSLISLKAFNHCCDFIWSPSAKVGQEGHLARLLWGQRKYELHWDGRLVLSNQYCTINTANELIQLAEWSKVNALVEQKDCKRLKLNLPKRQEQWKQSSITMGFSDFVQLENWTWTQTSPWNFWSVYPTEWTGTSLCSSENTTTPKFCLLNCLLNTFAL